MHDLALLLAEPGRERHVLDLWSVTPGPGVSVRQAMAEGLHQPLGPDAMIDDVARSRYRRRLAELEHQVTEDAERGDPTAAASARRERDQLLDQLAAAYGIGGRTRRMPDEVERARKAVRRRISDALKRIQQADPALGRHLRYAVHTGVYCSYEPERDIRWTTSAHVRGSADDW